VARLVGSPPGYVGHDEEGQLTGRLRAAPYSLVLFDEVEKAHPRILDLFLQLFGDGRLTDAKGRLADGRQAVFVMTSNLGAGPGRQPMGFPADGRPVVSGGDAANEIQRFFRPELLNRVDEVISFQPLGRDAAGRILRPLLESLTTAVARQHGVELSFSPEAMAHLAEVGFSATQGAREMRRTVERLVEAPLSQLVLSGLLAGSRCWRLVRVPTGVEIQPI
jgi:ATP-dependent Clp protease ATP-binding subunit ClpC